MVDITRVLAKYKASPQSIELCPPQRMDQLCERCGHVWRERRLSPLATIQLFLIQILNGNTAINHLRHLATITFAAASYCEARARLPLALIEALFDDLTQRVAEFSGELTMIGRRILLADASSFSMPDTKELREHFGLGGGSLAVVGVNYPVAKLMGLIDAASGMIVKMLALPLYTHDMSCVLRLSPELRPGDILVGDRALCSWVHLALLNAAGVFGCFRLHQRRKEQRSGTVRWEKPKIRPLWMNPLQFATLPAFIDVRIVRYQIREKGFRTTHVLAATTLMDQELWPDSRIAELYGIRWQIETCFDHLKTTMKMNVLKCQSVAGVMKEVAMYCLAYNLVRLAMLKAARMQRVSVGRISLIDVVRALAALWSGDHCAARIVINPLRPNRLEPRVIRRRLMEYPVMKRPRAELRRAAASERGA